MKDYEFPVGWELVQHVVDDFRKGRQLRDLFLQHSDFSESELDDFLEALHGSSQNSVDAFLEEQQDYLNIGIATMSMVLVRCEKSEELYKNRDPWQNWLRNLLMHMRGTKFDEFHMNAVSFITFNYDRSLEFFLCRSLAYTFSKSETESGEIMKKIPIIHLHGRLGYLAWQEEKGRPYDPTINKEVLDDCIKHVKVVNRNTELDADEFSKAKDLLAKAERIYFLGVGFNNENLARLGVMDLESNRAQATGVGLNGNEHNEVSNRFGPSLKIRQNTNCIGLLRNFVAWD